MTDRELLQQALDWFEDLDNGKNYSGIIVQIEALRAALAQPESEWQGLTKEEYEAMAEKYVTNCYFDTLKYARAIEAKLRSKNS